MQRGVLPLSAPGLSYVEGSQLQILPQLLSPCLSLALLSFTVPFVTRVILPQHKSSQAPQLI